MNIPIYVNSLARATDRRAAIKARLDAAGVNYEIVDAIDGKTQLGDYADQVRHEIAYIQYGRKLRPGRCGNYFSHYQLWKKIAEMDVPAALIFEDDAVWNDDFFGVIDELINCKWEWDLVNLADRVLAGRTYTHKVKRKVCDLGKDYSLVQFKRTRHYSMAYLVTPAGAKKLIEHMIPMRIGIDKYWNEVWLHKTLHYNVHPPVAFHSEVESTLDDGSSKGKPFWIARTAWLNARIRTYRRRWFYFTHPPKLRHTPGEKLK